MTSIASILNDCGIPWPDADSGRAREAAATWKKLASAAQEALNQGNSAASSLASNNTGPAMEAFSQYWDGIGGPSSKSMLHVLVDCANGMSTACDKFADAVDELKTKLEETGAEIAAALAAGAAATIFTLGISDAISGSVSAALIGTAFGAIEIFGTAIADIVGTMAVGAAAGALDAMFDTAASNSVKTAFGESKDLPSVPDELLDVLEGAGLGAASGGVGKVATSGLSAAALAGMAQLPDDISALAPQLPGMLAAIPSALETPAGEAITAISSEYATKSAIDGVQGKSAEAPSIEDILGELMDAKIEAGFKGEEGG